MKAGSSAIPYTKLSEIESNIQKYRVIRSTVKELCLRSSSLVEVYIDIDSVGTNSNLCT